MDIEQYKNLSSRVSKRQQEYVRAGDTQKDARNKASAFIGMEQIPPVTGFEVESLLARARNELFEKSQPVFESIEDIEEVTDVSVVQMYRDWCSNNDHVAKDAELSYFTGNTPNSYAAARSYLARIRGFIFSKDPTGWSVAAPEPEPEQEEKKYTEAEMLNKFAEFLKSQK